MRVTRESLIRIARETAQERAFNDREIIAAYLTGSLVSENDPMLGGVTDIDIVLVHSGRPGVTREIAKLTPDFHLDLTHRARDEFKSPRDLRTDPILGYEMYDPMLLYQREKFFEFVQAGLRAGFEFHAPALVLGRCRRLLAEARKGWIDLMDIAQEQAGPLQVKQYLRALYQAGNTIAELTGGPLPERRFLLEFPARAEAADRPNFTHALLGLLGMHQLNADLIADWLPEWKKNFLSACESSKVDVRIHPGRLNYYEKGIQYLLNGENPFSALWPLLHTWTLSATVLDEPACKTWVAACGQLGLLGTGFEGHIEGLDHFIDEIEAHLDEIAAKNGLETSSSL